MARSEKPDAQARILIVDDDPAARRAIRMHLEDEGFEVVEAEDGPCGLPELRRRLPDVVLLELRMSGMDGLEVLAALREFATDLPVIVISARGTMEDVILALRLGAWDYVVKSGYDFEALEHAMEAALDRARVAREQEQHRRRLEEMIARKTREFINATVAVEHKNVALREVAATIEQLNEQLAKRVVANVERNVLPLLGALRAGLSSRQQLLVDQVEANLVAVVSPFTHALQSEFAALTPSELRICTHIARGLANKQIAQVEGISSGTVNLHRNSIRRKLGLIGTGRNLTAYLQKFGAQSVGGDRSFQAGGGRGTDRRPG